VWQVYVVQTVEGEESAVRAPYEKIATDRRHEAITLLEAQPVESRAFALWSMARISDNDQPSGMPILTNRHEGDTPEPGHETRESDPVIVRCAATPAGCRPSPEARRRRRSLSGRGDTHRVLRRENVAPKSGRPS